MKISIIGTGYVGLVSVACLADFGMNIICMDNDVKKIEMLNKGEIPIFEPGLSDLIKRNASYKWSEFTTSIKKATGEDEVIFIVVRTPSNDDGSADLRHIKEAIKNIAHYMNGYKIIVNKSTVPIGTGKKVREIIQNILEDRKLNYKFDIVSNP